MKYANSLYENLKEDVQTIKGVKVYYEDDGEPLLVFKSISNRNGGFDVYSHNGQHASATKDYLKTLKKANKNDQKVKDLIAEYEANYPVKLNLKEDWIKRYRGYSYYPHEDKADTFIVVNEKDNTRKEICATSYDDAKKYIKDVFIKKPIKEADDIQTRATKMLSEKKYQIDMAWKNGKTWQTEPMTLKEIGDSVGQSVSEDQFVSMMADNIKNRKDAKNLTKAEIVKLYDYMNGQWKDKEVLWSLNDKTNENLNEDVNTNELADFILKNVNEGLDFDGLAYYELDGDLAVSIGWLEGYDPKDAEFGDIVNEDGYGLNVAITENPSRYAYVDFDYLNQPYDEETGDV